jgi:hypothetical protein
MLFAQGQDPEFANTGAYAVAAPLAAAIFRTYALKMAGVFLFSLGTMWLRTGVMPRWVALSQFAVGAVLIFGFGTLRQTWISLVFPLWILVISVLMLLSAYRRPSGITPVDLERERM